MGSTNWAKHQIQSFLNQLENSIFELQQTTTCPVLSIQKTTIPDVSRFQGQNPFLRAKTVTKLHLCYPCPHGKHFFFRNMGSMGAPALKTFSLDGWENIFRNSKTPHISTHQQTILYPPHLKFAKKIQAMPEEIARHRKKTSARLGSVTFIILFDRSGKLNFVQKPQKVPVLCDSACKNSWISMDVDEKLNVHFEKKTCYC